VIRRSFGNAQEVFFAFFIKIVLAKHWKIKKARKKILLVRSDLKNRYFREYFMD